MKNHPPTFKLAYILLIIATCACNKAIKLTEINKGDVDYCLPNVYTTDNSNPIYTNSDSILNTNIRINNYILNDHDKLMANALGVLSIIDTAKPEEQLTKIHHKIVKFDQEIESIAAQLDCEGERTDQIANYVDNINQKRTARLTALSIIAGSITTILTVGLKNNDAQNATAIIGGLTSSILSIVTINPSGKKIIWNQNENILEDIWSEKNKHKFFPKSLWYILNTEKFSNSGKISLIQSIKDRWLSYIFNNKMDDKTTDLYFKNGGTFHAEDLHNRATMLNQLQATIRSIHQDLSSFTTNIDQYYN